MPPTIGLLSDFLMRLFTGVDRLSLSQAILSFDRYAPVQHPPALGHVQLKQKQHVLRTHVASSVEQ